MPKKIWILLILSLIVCGCAQEEPANPYRLKTQVHTSYFEGETTIMAVTYFYDDQGRISHYEEEDGTIARHTYDDYGNLIRSETKGTDGTDVVSEYILTLDEKHRPVRSEHYWNGELGSITVYGYDKSGNVIQQDTDRVLPDGNIQSWATMKYDRKGNLTREETKWSHSDGTYTLYEYEDGRVSRFFTYDIEDTLQRYTTFTWDEATRTEYRKNYLGEGEVAGHSISYFDEFGNCLKTKYYNGSQSPMGGGDDVLDRLVEYTYELIPE